MKHKYVFHFVTGQPKEVKALTLMNAAYKAGFSERASDGWSFHDLVAYDVDGVRTEVRGAYTGQHGCVYYAEENRACDHDLQTVGLPNSLCPAALEEMNARMGQDDLAAPGY